MVLAPRVTVPPDSAGSLARLSAPAALFFGDTGRDVWELLKLELQGSALMASSPTLPCRTCGAKDCRGEYRDCNPRWTPGAFCQLQWNRGRYGAMSDAGCTPRVLLLI